MNLATKPQVQKVQILIRSLGFLEDKDEIILEASNTRTKSTRELTFIEAKDLITRLCEYDPKEKQIKSIRMIAYKCGIIYGDSEEDRKINYAKLNLFLKEKGTVKKNLLDQDFEELVKTHKQFSAISRSMNNSKQKREFHNEVDELLKGLLIPVKH